MVCSNNVYRLQSVTVTDTKGLINPISSNTPDFMKFDPESSLSVPTNINTPDLSIFALTEHRSNVRMELYVQQWKRLSLSNQKYLSEIAHSRFHVTCHLFYL